MIGAQDCMRIRYNIVDRDLVNLILLMVTFWFRIIFQKRDSIIHHFCLNVFRKSIHKKFIFAKKARFDMNALKPSIQELHAINATLA